MSKPFIGSLFFLVVGLSQSGIFRKALPPHSTVLSALDAVGGPIMATTLTTKTPTCPSCEVMVSDLSSQSPWHHHCVAGDINPCSDCVAPCRFQRFEKDKNRTCYELPQLSIRKTSDISFSWEITPGTSLNNCPGERSGEMPPFWLRMIGTAICIIPRQSIFPPPRIHARAILNVGELKK